jgi:hypothetical protein
VKNVAIRGNGGTATAAKSVDIEIGMTTTLTSPWAPNTTFSSNLGTDYKIVFNRKVVNLPAQPNTPIPAPFVASFALDVPFVYTRAAGNLLIDYFNRATSTGTYSQDTSFTLAASITAVGTPCANENQTVTGGQKLNATSVVTFTLANGPASAAYVHILGSMALPAPIPLPYGGCKLYQDFLLLLPGATDASGGAVLSYPLPPMARDLVIYGQYVTVNPVGPKFGGTQSHRVAIGGLDSHCRIYNLSSDTSPTGSTQLGVGIVTELK